MFKGVNIFTCNYMSIMNRFPLEIVHRILEYDGRIKYRHGKYVNQIAPDDDRYKMLKQIPKIRLHKHIFYTIIYSFDKQCCFEKYETLWYSENPIINIYTSSKIGHYMYKKEDICYKFTIRRPPPPPTSFIRSVIVYLYDLYRKFI
jgi:hypothetical protein